MKKTYLPLVISFLLSLPISYAQSFQLDALYNCPENSLGDAEYYVLDFWATWCGPCVRSLPHFNQVNAQNPYENFTFISVSNEQREVIDKFRTYHTPLDACIGIDKDFSIMKEYGHKFIPIALVLDRNGNLVWEGQPLELDTSVLNDIQHGQLETVRKEIHREFSINGPSEEEGSSVALSTGQFLSLDLKGKSIDNIYNQLFLLRDGEYVKLHFENEPEYAFSYDCLCKVDSLNHSEEEFYNYCLESLNRNINAELDHHIDTFDYYSFSIVDTAMLYAYLSSQDSTLRTIDKDFITYNKYPLGYVFSSICGLYNLDTEFDPREAPDFFKKEFDLKIRNVELEDLKAELEKIGISYRVVPKAEKVYAVRFE